MNGHYIHTCTSTHQLITRTHIETDRVSNMNKLGSLNSNHNKQLQYKYNNRSDVIYISVVEST